MTIETVTTQDKPAINRPSNPLLMPADLNTSRRMTARLSRVHYENFLVSSVLLPRRMRQPFADIYAFCRTADDAADESPTPEIAIQRLGHLREGLAQMFAGDPPRQALFVALAATVERFDLDPQPFDDLLDAFLSDQSTTRYDDPSQLVAYCRRSAAPVGRIVLAMAGADDESNIRDSDSICVGLQLINFWQDIKRDLAIGRIYVPATMMDSFGVTRDDLSAAKPTPAVHALMVALVDWADRCFEPAARLSAAVPRWLSPSIDLFAGGGRATADAIRRADYDVLSRRPVVRRRTQIALVLKAALARPAATLWQRDR